MRSSGADPFPSSRVTSSKLQPFSKLDVNQPRLVPRPGLFSFKAKLRVRRA